MHSRSMAMGLCLAAAVIGVPAAATRAAAPPTGQTAGSPDLAEVVNTAMGLMDSRLVTLNLDPVVGEPLVVQVPIFGALYALDLEPFSVRTDDYRVYLSDDGGLHEIEPGPINTLRGDVMGHPGSRVVGSILDEGLHVMVDFGDGGLFWVEPVAGRVPGTPPSLYVVYHDDDIIPADGRCGTNDKLEGARGLPEGNPVAGTTGCEELSVAELACDADNPYFNDYGGGTEARINAVINQVNVQYESQVGITHVITTIIIRTSPVYASNDAFTLLDQFRDRWLQFHSGVQRDVAHLFTGRELNGGTIGIAWDIGAICTNGAYCLSQSDCCGSFGCATDLTAHELGHLWGAFHCDPCNATMRSFIGCFNNFTAGSRASIISHRNSRTCLDGGPLPYCAAFSTGGSADNIARVQLGDIDQVSGGANDGYTSWVCEETELEIGPLHPITVTVGSGSANTTGGLWIDWNQDLDFNDANETITTGWSGPGPYTMNITVPGAASLGATIMRVRVQDGGTPNDCGAVTEGEVEDYTVIIVDDFPGPANDACADAIAVGDGTTAYSNISASTDGPDEPFQCNVNGYSQVGSDVWFTYVSTCTGFVTVSLCGSDFNTKLVIYDDCPTVALPTLLCDDDGCGEQSQGSFFAILGQSYTIRVGGFEGAQGSGDLTITPDCFAATGACCYDDGSCLVQTASDCGNAGGSYAGDSVSCAAANCPQPPTCPQDLNGDTIIGFVDLLDVLSNWGPCTGCPQDLDGNGNVGFPEVLDILSNWGPCP